MDALGRAYRVCEGMAAGKDHSSDFESRISDATFWERVFEIATLYIS